MKEFGALLGFISLTLLVGAPFAGIAFAAGPMLKRFHRVYWLMAVVAYCAMMAIAVGGWMSLLDNDAIARIHAPIYLWGRWILLGMTLTYWGCCTVYWFDTVSKTRAKTSADSSSSG